MTFRSDCRETFSRNANGVRAIPRSARFRAHADGVGAKRGGISVTAAIRTTLRGLGPYSRVV